MLLPAARYVCDLKAHHEGTQGLVVNDTFVRRFLTLLALKTTARIYSRAGSAVPISRHLIVKLGPLVHLTEAATMRFVTKNTALPVPKVYCAFVRKSRAYVVMERIQGESLSRVWGSLSKESRHRITSQLQRMFDELRRLQPPKRSGVESCIGGSLHDSRITHSLPRITHSLSHKVPPVPRFGPFNSIQKFHLWLREGLNPSEHPEREVDHDWIDIKDMVEKQDGPWPATVFTHGDLNPSNIIVRGDEVVGIIDWEFAGWYPPYWDYTSAWCGAVTHTAWREGIDEFLERYPKQLRMELTRQRWWGEV